MKAIADRTVSQSLVLEFYRQMVTIRLFEEDVVQLFGKGLISGSTHPCIGQEAISVGATAALEKNDQVLSTYRGHGQFLAKGGDPGKGLAELLNRDTGCCKGKGGSMHLCDPEIGFLGSNAIVAAHIPIAAGVSLANKLKRNSIVTLCFFGDGASCEGVFYETANIAALWKLPLVMVCENNEYAISVHTSRSISVPDISTRAAAFGFPGVSIDGNDVLEVYETTKHAVERARRGEGPTLIECKTVRWERHSAISSGLYKSREDAKRWQITDPIPRYRDYVLNSNMASDSELKDIDQEARKVIDEAVQFAQQSPPTAEFRLLEDIFV
jgi:TPP-dependent pyruvate/acetoin dehydrogenase alpha subunit